FFLFFQAEDGIRFWSVTGVQTCALPICPTRIMPSIEPIETIDAIFAAFSMLGIIRVGRIANWEKRQDEPRRAAAPAAPPALSTRSEERRVGKEGRARWSR